MDIVSFAREFCDIELRPYQTKVLQRPHPRMMMRWPRRAGKTEAIVISALYEMLSNKNQRVLVAGPQKVHSGEVFGRMREYIAHNEKMKEWVVRDVSAPWYEIKFDNGSRVRGFGLGLKGRASQGVGVCGQDADIIYVDELNAIVEKSFIGSLLPILQTSPETRLLGFSSVYPSKTKTAFYSLCKENPDYFESHLTYKELPFAENIRKERESFRDEIWEHEYMADWTEAEYIAYRKEGK